MKSCLLLFGVLALSMATFAQVPYYVPPEALLTWYSFDENTDDISGNGNDLIGTADYTAGHTDPGWAVTNFQTDDPLFCEFPNFIFGRDSSFTISCWIKSNDSLSGGMIAKHWNQVTSSDFTWGIGKSSTRLAFSCAGGFAGWTSCYYNEAIPVGIWLHIIASYESGMMKFYINTDLVESNYCTDTSTTSQLRFRVGHDPWNNSVLTDVDVDDMGLWNRILTADEREALFISAVGLHQMTLEDNILLYPIPSHGIINLEIKDSYSSSPAGEINIYSILGECVYHDHVLQKKMQFDLGKMVKGIYFINIHSGQTILTKRLVIQ